MNKPQEKSQDRKEIEASFKGIVQQIKEGGELLVTKLKERSDDSSKQIFARIVNKLEDARKEMYNELDPKKQAAQTKTASLSSRKAG